MTSSLCRFLWWSILLIFCELMSWSRDVRHRPSILVQADRLQGKPVQVAGLLAAFGDFDSDKYTDLFLIHSNKKSFEIQKANGQDHHSFSSQPELSCNTSSNEQVLGLIPADFHGEAMMDVIVITRPSTASSRDPYRLYLIKGERNSLNCSPLDSGSYFAISRIQPLLLDFNGDMIGDLLIQHEDGTRQVYMFKNGQFTTHSFPGTNLIRRPNSNAFIDLNHDFIPDVFIEEDIGYVYYYLTGNPQPNWNLHSRRLPRPPFHAVGMSTFFDLNSDGRIEHLVPVCFDRACNLGQILAWNLQQNRYIAMTDQLTYWGQTQRKLCFTPQQTHGQIIFPLKLRHTDVDGDGFIDLIGIMNDCARPNPNHTMIILRNQPNATNPFGRSFQPYWQLSAQYELPLLLNEEATAENVDSISDKKEPIPLMATFLDIGEDGRPDMILQSYSKDQYVINTLINRQMVDACFLKVMVISGRCYDDCGKSIEKTIPNPFTSYNVLGYGTNQAGQSIYFELVDSEGHKRKSCAGQMSQSADFSLQMPYNVFGLGQLPNFIDTLVASIPIDNTGETSLKSNNFDNQKGIVVAAARKQTWAQIVPDSQVVVIPHPPNEPSLWRTKLFITPSEYVISTLITLLCICLLLIILIYFLWRKEMLEDLAEHKEYKKHWPESK